MALGYALAHYAFLFQDPVGIDAVAASCFLRLEGATNSAAAVTVGSSKLVRAERARVGLGDATGTGLAARAAALARRRGRPGGPAFPPFKWCDIM